MFRLNEPHEWPLGGSNEDYQELGNIFLGRACSSLDERDTLA